MSAHIFVDNSNIFGGAQRTASIAEPTVPWQAVRLYFRNFAWLLEGTHDVATRVLGGSVPPANEDLWKYARELSYDTSLLRRLEQDDGRLTEQGVDEIIHLKIANALLDNEPPQTLVLATGDGGAGDFGTSFEAQVARALRLGWDVEIWSWSLQLSGRFGRLVSSSGAAAKIRPLDPYYRSITFVKGGDYHIDGVTLRVDNRIVQPL